VMGLGLTISSAIVAGFATHLTHGVAANGLSLGHNAVIGKTR